MSWKESKDGGLDYDVKYDIKRQQMQERHRIAREKLAERYRNAKEEMFNPYGSAHTMTFNTNTEHVEF